MSRGPSCSWRTVDFHPGFLQHRLKWMGWSPRGGRSAQTTHRWVLWVPGHPVGGGAEPVLTPTQGPTSPGGSFLSFLTPVPPSPGSPSPLGWRKPRCSAGAQPRGCVWEPVMGGREEPQLCGPQKCPSPSPHPYPLFLGSHPNSGCRSPRLRARRRGYLHRGTHGPGQGAMGASPHRQNPELLSRVPSRFHDTLKSPGRFWGCCTQPGSHRKHPTAAAGAGTAPLPGRSPLCNPELFIIYMSIIKQKQLWLLPPFR